MMALAGLAGGLFLGVAGARAGQAPSAAELDWRPRAELPESVQQRLPVFCDGGYLPSGAGLDSPLAGDGAAPGQPLQASGLNARYEIDRTLHLEGDVRIRQGAFEVTGEEARYDQAAGQVSVLGPLVSRGQGFLLTGESAEYNVDSGRFDINTATFLLHGPEMRGSAAGCRASARTTSGSRRAC